MTSTVQGGGESKDKKNGSVLRAGEGDTYTQNLSIAIKT